MGENRLAVNAESDKTGLEHGKRDKMFFYIITMIILGIAALQDIRTKTIPFWMLAAAGSVAILSSSVDIMDGIIKWYAWIPALIPGLSLLLIAYLSKEAIGYGDGLMILLLGPVFGLTRMTAGVCLAFFLSSFFSIALMMLHKAKRKTTFPFIPFLASAMGVILFATI